jgi:hypothetical protein
MSLITLRPAVPTDQDFLLKVYTRTRADEMKRVDWDAAQKEAFLLKQATSQSFPLEASLS